MKKPGNLCKDCPVSSIALWRGNGSICVSYKDDLHTHIFNAFDLCLVFLGFHGYQGIDFLKIAKNIDAAAGKLGGVQKRDPPVGAKGRAALYLKLEGVRNSQTRAVVYAGRSQKGNVYMNFLVKFFNFQADHKFAVWHQGAAGDGGVETLADLQGVDGGVGDEIQIIHTFIIDQMIDQRTNGGSGIQGNGHPGLDKLGGSGGDALFFLHENVGLGFTIPEEKGRSTSPVNQLSILQCQQITANGRGGDMELLGEGFDCGVLIAQKNAVDLIESIRIAHCFPS